MTIPIHPDFGGLDKGGQKGGRKGGQMVPLTERQAEIHAILKEKPKISRKELAGALGINESVIQKHFDNLKKKGIIE